VQRAFDWFSELNLAQKVLAVLVAALFLFSLSYLFSTVVLYLGGAGGQAGSPPEKGAAPTPRAPALRVRSPTSS